MIEREILWRETWPGESTPDHLSAYDGKRRIGRIYPQVTLVAGREWLWFAAGVHATGRCDSGERRCWRWRISI